VAPEEIKRMRYFVTGATGFIGKEVARQLRAQGHDVVAIARNPDIAGDLRDMGVTVVKGDVTDKESMRAAMVGLDGVFHIAGWFKLGTKDKSEGAQINIAGTRNVLSLMQELRIPKGVYTSTLAVNSDTKGQIVDESHRFAGTHISEYDRTKAAAHEIAEDFIKQGLPLVIVQPGLVYGPGDGGPAHDTFKMYLQRKLPLLTQSTSYAWGYIDDIAEAHLRAMEKGKAGENYFICGPVHTLTETMKLAEKITGVPLPKIVASAGMVNVMARLTGLVDGKLNLTPMYTSEFLRATNATYLGSNEKAKRELGWSPRSIEEGLPPTLKWEMEQLGMPQK
jgi:nucleoside-diphosphate-sugar epimerase